MENNIIDILVCPFHRADKLRYEKEKGYLLCSACNRKYKINNVNGIEIPDFIIDSGNVNRGFRDVDSNLLSNMQGKPFSRAMEQEKLVLDIGCGDNARGNINVDCYIPKKIPVNFILANAEFLPFKDNSVDIVISNYSIEHTINPAIFIKGIYKIAKEKIEIVTDNSEWIGDVFFRLYGAGRIFHDEHYYKWSVEYFRNLLKSLGYKKNSVCLLNLSSSFFVRIFSIFGKLPRIGNFFYRDLKAQIWKE